MKIIFIDSYFNSLYGAQKSMINLCSLMRDRGHHVTISSMREGELLNEARRLEFDLFSFEAYKTILRSVTELKSFLDKIVYLALLIFFWCKVILKLPSLVKNDAICINDTRTFVFLLPILIFTRHKNIWYIRIRENNALLMLFLSFFCKSVIFISSDVKKKSRISSKTKKYTLMTGFQKYQLSFATNVESVKTINFVTVGSINERKNQMEVIEIFKYISSCINAKCNLHIYGGYEPADYSYYESLKIKIKSDNEINHSIHFYGYVSEVIPVIEHYDVFLFASRREGLPRSIIEALQAGLYVICKPVDGVSDIIKDPSFGLVLNMSDDMNEINFNKLFAFSLSQGEREKRNSFINDFFSNEVYGDKFEEILKR